MNVAKVYSEAANRSSDIELETKEEQENRILLEEDLKRWLSLSKTKELLIFLARSELELLNNARNASRVDSVSNVITKNLHKSIAYREIIDYLTTNKQPTE